MELGIEKELFCDVLVIGTEGAGARTALEAAAQGADVLAVTKGYLSRSGATLTADGEIDIDSCSARKLFGVNGSTDDNPEIFAQDMIREGDYLANQKLVAIHTEEAPARVKELVDWGSKLEGFIHAPGHSYPRGLWIPGLKLTRLLGRRMLKSGIRVLENTMVLDLLWDADGVVGAVGLHLPSGRLVVLHSKAVVLATGGAMRLFPQTTAPNELTGDGLAMAMRANVILQDMEFPMFLPYCFLRPQALEGVIFSYDASALLEVHALNRHGERFMARWDPKRMERSTRDINSVASAMEIRNGRGSQAGGVYLSFKHLPRNLVQFSSKWFPENLRGWQAAGFKLQDFFPSPGDEAWEVAPACHFWNGGLRIDETCATNVPGLFAAGEGTAGIHGANRLAGNALTMTQVWGRRAGKYAAEYAAKNKPRPALPDQTNRIVEKFSRLQSNTSGPSVTEIRTRIRYISGSLVGIIREEAALKKAIAEIHDLRHELPNQHVSGQGVTFNREWVEGLQNENLLDILEAVTRASLLREESRGAMFRVDYPQTNDDQWLCNLIIQRQNGDWNIQKTPIQGSYMTLPTGQRNYGNKGEC